MAAFLRIRGTTVLTRMWKVFISKLMAVVTFALFVLPSGLLASAAALAETPQSDEELSRKILGAWDRKKQVTYFADGTWMLQKSARSAAAAGIFTWSIHDGKLILIRDGHRFIETIKSLSATELVLQPDEGQPEVDVRGAQGPLPYPQVKRNGRIFPPDPEAADRALETVYNTLRSRLGGEARQRLERDQLGWLINRETWRTNADPHRAKWTVEDLTYFTDDRVMILRTQLEQLSD